MEVQIFTVLHELLEPARPRKPKLTNQLQARCDDLRSKIPEDWSELHLPAVHEVWDGGSKRLRAESDAYWMATQLGFNPNVAKLSLELASIRLAPPRLRRYLATLPDRSVVIVDSLIAMRLLGRELADGYAFRYRFNPKKQAMRTSN